MNLIIRWLSCIVVLFISNNAIAGSPLWTFTPLTATTLSLPSNTTATIQYVVTNQSRKSHTLMMKSINGMTQTVTMGSCGSPFTLDYQQSCILTLSVNSNALQGDVLGGPEICQQGNALQCYQPSPADILNITRVTAPNATTLSQSTNTLTLQSSGNARVLTLTNTGSVSATSVTYNASPSLPTGTIISPANCGTIAPGSTCILAITPGATPSATPGDTSPAPITLNISGSNTNTLSVTVNIVTYGSVYQEGYIYAIDDTTPSTGSIGGKVISLTDQAPAIFNGVVWSSNGASSMGSDASLDTLPGIDETSTSSSGSPTYGTFAAFFSSTYANPNPFTPASFQSCAGNSNGECNTNNILTFYNQFITNYGIGSPPYSASVGPTNFTFYAAGLCKQAINGYSDWYLPAICELGPGAGCPSIGNIVDNIPSLIGAPFSGNPSTNCAYGSNCISGVYWSSTLNSGNPSTLAHYELFDSSGGSSQATTSRQNTFGVRCSRNLIS